MPFISLRELEAEAKRRLDPAVYDYFAGGADDEITLGANEAAFSRIGLVPRVLRGAGERDLNVTLLDQRVSMPVIIAPTAFHRLADPEGERATARAAHAAGTIMVVSMASTVGIEDLAAVNDGNLWFQIYIQPDLAFTEAIVGRAEAAGCGALVVTVDSPVFGRRERDALRRLFRCLPLQPALHARVLADGNIEPHPRRALEMRTEDRAGRQYNGVALRVFRQRQRVVDMRETGPQEYTIYGLREQFQSNAFERTHDIEPRVTYTLVQARQIFAVMAVDQHQIN